MASWQRQLCEAELKQLTYLHTRQHGGDATPEAAPEAPERSSSPRLVVWNCAASEQKARNAELLEGLGTAHAEVASAGAAVAEATEGAQAAADTTGQLKAGTDRISAFMSVRPKSMTAQWEKWILQLLSAADKVRGAQDEYAPYAPPPPLGSPSSIKEPSAPAAKGGKSGNWSAARRGIPVARLSAREKRLAAEKAAAEKAAAEKAATEQAAAEQAAAERAVAERAAAERAKTGELASDEEILRRAEERAKRRLGTAVEEMARLVQEARAARQAWEIEMLQLTREEEALLQCFGVEPPERRLPAAVGPTALESAPAPDSLAPIFIWSGDMERVDLTVKELAALAPAPTAVVADDELPPAPTPAPSPARLSPALHSPPAAVLSPAASSPRASPRPKVRPKLPSHKPFSPQPRPKGSFMQGTGSSSARIGERGSDSSWLMQSHGLPPPRAGRLWLLRDLDRDQTPRHRRPKLPEVWAVGSPPRAPIVVTAHGGAASTSIGHAMRPLSARLLVARPVSVAPGGMRGGSSLPPGCWGSLALRQPPALC